MKRLLLVALASSAAGCRAVLVDHRPPPSHIVVETWHTPYVPVPRLEAHPNPVRPHHKAHPRPMPAVRDRKAPSKSAVRPPQPNKPGGPKPPRP